MGVALPLPPPPPSPCHHPVFAYLTSLPLPFPSLPGNHKCHLGGGLCLFYFILETSLPFALCLSSSALPCLPTMPVYLCTQNFWSDSEKGKEQEGGTWHGDRVPPSSSTFQPLPFPLPCLPFPTQPFSRSGSRCLVFCPTISPSRTFCLISPHLSSWPCMYVT